LPDKGACKPFPSDPARADAELTPDRPDKIESPYAVDAGHFRLEMEVVTFTQNRSNDVRIDAWNIAPVDIKIGLLNDVDLQIIFGN
jgi:hypothetical protein